MKLTTTEHIAASPAEVWSFISDANRYPEWVVGTKEVLSVSALEASQGTLYRERTQIGPSTPETRWEVTAFDTPYRQVHISKSAAINAVLTMLVEPEGDGTRFTHIIETTLFPKFRPLGWLLEQALWPQVVKDMAATLRQARQIVEREHGPVKNPSSLHGSTSI